MFQGFNVKTFTVQRYNFLLNKTNIYEKTPFASVADRVCDEERTFVEIVILLYFQ